MTEEVFRARLPGWVREYSPRLVAAATAMLGDPAEAEDIVQEVWVAAFNNHKRLQEGHLLGWLYGVTLNLTRSRLRRATRRASIWERFLGGHDDRPERSARADQVIDRMDVLAAVSRLPKLQRDVVVARYLEGQSTRETARSVNRAEGTVKASLHKALQTLRRTLDRSDWR